MIGQKPLLDELDTLYEHGGFPRFAIFIGATGMGKRTLMREIANKYWDIVIELPDVKVDTVRGMIDEAYRLANPTVYIIPDGHKMSPQAKNALLKVTEEPPNKATFLMSVTSTEALLHTLSSRGTKFYLRPYSEAERSEYIDSCKVNLDSEDRDLIMQTCISMLEIDTMLKSKPGELYDYANKLIDNIADVSVANMLKTSKSIAFKEDDEGYNLELLLKVVCFSLRMRMDENESDRILYAGLISQTVRTLGELHLSTISRPNTFDDWLIKCRRIIKEYGQ